MRAPSSRTPKPKLTLQQSLDSAIQQHNAGNVSKARILYKKLLKIDPNQTDALHLLGIITYQNGEHDKAVGLIKKALKINPKFAQAHSNLSNIHRELGQLEDAISHAKKAIEIKSNFAEAHHNLGAALQDSKQLDNSIISYQNALLLNPNLFESYNNLGNVMRDLGRLDEAIKHYHNALSIEANYAEAYNNLGTAWRELGQLKEAEKTYKKALSIAPNYAEAHNNLGNVMRDLGNLNNAVKHYGTALTIEPNFAEAHNNLGATLQWLGKLPEAIVSYQKALSINPDFPVHNNLGTTFQELGMFEDAMHHYNLATSIDAKTKYLECLYATERYEDFYNYLKKMLEHNQNNIRAAAISAFVSHQLARSDPYPFCKNPINFVRIYNTQDIFSCNHKFLKQLISTLKNKTSIWEPTGKTTLKGFQSANNLFKNPKPLLATLEKIIRDKIEQYTRELADKDCNFIRLMPKNAPIRGWTVRLLQGGHQTEHIHPSGWLSGVFYLQIPHLCNQEEGSIEFGLWGYNYPILEKNYPKKRFYPKIADIALFPSSLFHRTIPFNSDEERITIAFDLIPD